MPAPEELIAGYTPPVSWPGSAPKEGPGKPRARLRAMLVAVFVALGMLVALERTVIESDEAGARRVAEVKLAERKPPCRGCQ